MQIFEKLEKFFSKSVKLIHCIGYEDYDYVNLININSGTSIETILNTRCASTVTTIKFLLNFIELNDLDLETFYEDYSIDLAYEIEMVGFTNEYNLSETGHVFLLCFIDENWHIIDSYYLNRTLTFKLVDIEDIINLIKKIVKNFNISTWFDLTDEQSKDKTNRMEVYIKSYQYDSNNENIDGRFNELVDLSLN